MDLLIIIIFSILVIPLVFFDILILRIVFGLLLVLFSPGYVLITLLFPKKNDLDNIERLAFSFGLSIAIVPIMGLILNFSPLGLSLYNIMSSIIIFVVIVGSFAYFRRKRIMSYKWYEPLIEIRLRSLSEWWNQRARWDKVVTILLGAIILAAAGAFSYFVVESKVVEKYTEFYILDAEGKTEHYPDKLAMGQTSIIIINIVNQEHELINYGVVIEIDGKKLIEINPIALKHNEKWQEQIDFMPIKSGSNQKVEFFLYKEGESKPYYSLYLWIDVE